MRHSVPMSVVRGDSPQARVVGRGTPDFDAVRARIAHVQAVHIDGLVLPARVIMQADDSVAVMEHHDEATTLRQVLHRRGGLKAGECVWWATRVARILAELHRAGLVHGALDADAVAFANGEVTLGRMALGSMALASMALGDAGPDANGERAGDVDALGRLLAQSVRAEDYDRVAAWVEPMCSPQSQARPTAAMVARALEQCAPSQEVQVPVHDVAGAMRRSVLADARVSVPSTEPRVTPRATPPQAPHPDSDVVPLPGAWAWRWRRRLVTWWTQMRSARWGASPTMRRVSVGAGVAVALIVVGGVWASMNARGDRVAAGAFDTSTHSAAVPGGLPPRTELGVTAVHTESSGSPTHTEPRQVVLPEGPAEAAARLTRQRLTAMATGDGAGLIALTVPGSPAFEEATASARMLDTGRMRVHGIAGQPLTTLSPTWLTVQADPPVAGMSVPDSLAAVWVTYELPGYILTIDGADTVVVPQRSTVQLTLQWTQVAGWQVSDVTVPAGIPEAAGTVQAAAASAPAT